MTKRYHRNALLVRERTFGNTFPAIPRDGERFFRTDLEETFSWDASNSAWLGEQKVMPFGKGGTGLNNEYLRAAHGQAAAAGGFHLPYGVVLTGLTAAWVATATTGNIIIRRDGSNILSSNLLVFGTTNTTMLRTGAFATFAAGGSMEVYLDTLSAAVGNISAMVLYRRRET